MDMPKDAAKNGLPQQQAVDLSSGEDLSMAVMNLISIEEHLFFTLMKTGNARYSDALATVRETRIALMRELVGIPEGEIWCVSKHLLASSMRLMEVGTKYLKSGLKTEAKRKFGDAYRMYTTFWELNIGAKPQSASTGGAEAGAWGLAAKIKGMLDCCKE